MRSSPDLAPQQHENMSETPRTYNSEEARQEPRDLTKARPCAGPSPETALALFPRRGEGGVAVRGSSRRLAGGGRRSAGGGGGLPRCAVCYWLSASRGVTLCELGLARANSAAAEAED